VRAEKVLAVTDAFTRTLISYPSDGLTIYGFMNTPHGGNGPFPVVIASHGYIEPSQYTTLDYTTRYADALARAGFLVLHPNLRGYAPSDDGPNRFRVGMAADVLNLAALVREQGGAPGPLALADPDAIGVWGHSMGGGVSLRAISVSPDIDAAVLYGAMSGDERANYERIRLWSGGTRGLDELDTPDADLRRVSPIYYLDRIAAAVSIHHGSNDGTVPPEWSADLCDRLQALNKTVECFVYEGQPHTFGGDGDRLFMQRVAEFFERELRGD
jgi:dipeptidyl aminopeptidase/acylaminoacyl peptidase